MGQQLANDGLISDKVRKPKRGQLDALSAAQLVDCINAGQTVKVVKPGKGSQAKQPAPLFEPEVKTLSLF